MSLQAWWGVGGRAISKGAVWKHSTTAFLLIEMQVGAVQAALTVLLPQRCSSLEEA